MCVCVCVCGLHVRILLFVIVVFIPLKKFICKYACCACMYMDTKNVFSSLFGELNKAHPKKKRKGRFVQM